MKNTTLCYLSRADGAVLMLVIDGRQPHSLGATYKDCIDVMLEYGAVNAGNLDGGSSTILLYDGEVLPLDPGVVHYCPKGHAHSVFNDGAEEMQMYCVVSNC